MAKKNKGLAKNPPSSWTCGECGRSYGRRYSLLLHIATAHKAPYTSLDTSTHTGWPSWGREGE